MRDSDIETMDKLTAALEKYLPISEYELFTEYLGVYDYLKAKRERQRENYQKKAEYHRENSKKWRKENKERHEAYQKKYYENKRAEKNK